MRRVVVIAVLACVALVAVPAGASAQNKLFQDFRKNGSIDPCKYSNQQLQNGLKNLPPDVQQYAPGYADQLRNGRGNCGGGGSSGQPSQDQGAAAPAGGGNSGGSGGAPAKPARPKPDVSAPPAPKRRLANLRSPTATPAITASPEGSPAPWWLYLLAGLALAGGALGFVAHRRGWGIAHRLRPLGAAFAEAGGRAADTAATTRDRLRFR